MNRGVYMLLAVAALAAAPATAQAQIHVTPALGAWIPASDLQGVRSGAEQLELDRRGTLALGLNVDVGWLRGSIAYASGATISEDGVEGREQIGDGSVLAVAADLVLRPLPRLLVQPYGLAGLGFKRQDYSYSRDGVGSNPLPADQREVALHIGIGADVMLGGIGVMAEISDYITRHPDGDFGQHDAFALVGLRVRVGGR
ncbi:MAG TPA: outer membrane beta-barrel protein [Longimicrobiales bacterium]|nr:outer membrane beta-barrel protein [Longimicrobiales bacterium]